MYKIQWLLDPKDAYKLIRLLGARSFDKICLRDYEFNIVDTYTNMIMYSSGVSTDETIKYLKRQIRKSKDRYRLNIELVRR